MIIEFNVQNFGSIKEKQTLSFEATKADDLESHYIINGPKGLRLLKLAMIYGANASGKTTILNSLEFLRRLVLEPLKIKTDEFDYSPFLFDSGTPNQSSVMGIDFIQNEIRYSYNVEFNKTAVISEELNYYNSTKANVYKRTTDLEKQFTKIDFGGKITRDKKLNSLLAANTLWNNTVLGGFLKTNLENHELTEVQNWFEQYLQPMIKSHSELDAFVTRNINEGEIKKEHVIDIIKKADFHISDVLIREEEKDIPDGLIEFLRTQIKAPKEEIDKFQNKGKITSVSLEFEHTVNGKKYPLSFDSESQGTKRYYGLAGVLALLIKKKVIFTIDELEASLHPDLFQHFIVSFLINTKSSQLLFTTHNREILNNKDVFRNDAIWFTDKNENCATELYSLADFDTKIIRDTTSIYNAYKNGKLGGVPNLGDNYIDLVDEKH